MYKPALVIGLGGTGVLTLRHLKAELLGSEQRKLPPQVRLVALDTVQEEKKSREGEVLLAALKTELEPGEYYWIGGDIYEYVRQVDRGEHPHVSSWFQAAQYLRSLPRAAFTLQRGAGQLRQFGRVAIFKDVAAPAQSAIYNIITRAISDIRGTGRFNSLDVYLVASVAGGTGAGMFVDIAYLVRQIAKFDARLGVTLRGFLVLPEAFSKIPGGIKDSMRARAVACMRENKRFMVDFDYELGYPMHYHPSGVESIWYSSMKEKLFDSVFHVDGQRQKNPLTDVLPEFGVAAMIADAIAAMLDKPREETEDRYAQHAANVITQAAEQGLAVGNQKSTAFDSAVGAFTISLPMHHILEDLSYRLALEVLEAMLAPARRDEDGYPTALADDMNAEVPGVRGRNAAARFLSAAEVQALGSGQKVAGTQLLKEILRVANSYSPQNPALISELSARDVRTWEYHLDPPGDTAEIRAVRERVQQELNSTLKAEVAPARREHPQDALKRIFSGVEMYKAYHLGREDPRTGQRVGGQYRMALQDYASIHLERFKLMLQVETINILNGGLNPDDPASTRKGGKLGYLMDFLGGVEEILGLFLRALNEAKKMREARQIRQTAENAVLAARREYEQKPGGFGASARQNRYLDAEQRLIDALRASVVEDMVRATANEMLEYTKSLRLSAESWAKTLGIGYDSIYALLLRGRRQIAEMINAENQVRVRHIVWDSEYEERLYRKYAKELRNGLDTFMERLEWRLERKQIGDREEFGYQLVVRTDEQTQDTLGLRGQERNLEILLKPSRDIFRSAWDQESILKYLMEKYPRHEELADFLSGKNEPCLQLRGGKVVPSNYLHIAFGNDPTERKYLDDVKYRLESTTQARGKLNDIINSADRFRCRSIMLLDLVPVDQIESYRASEPAYRSYVETVGDDTIRGRLGRETLHIFPAEVNAARFESRLHELQMPPREFHNDVVLQLENLDNFQLFVRCYAFGVVRRATIPGSAGGYESFYCLELPPEQLHDGVYGEVKGTTIYLTKPGPGDPDLLDAIRTFNYVGKDVRPEYYQIIEYPRVRRALESARSATVEVLTSGTLALPERITSRWNGLSDTEREKIRRLYAERMVLAEKRDEQEKLARSETLPIRARDLHTLFYLALADDVRNIENAIDDILKMVRRA